MRTPLIVMSDPCVQEMPQVVFGQRDQEVQAFTPEGAQEPLAKRICLRALGRRFEHCETEVADALIEVL
jgi:hypothetical protein